MKSCINTDDDDLPLIKRFKTNERYIHLKWVSSKERALIYKRFPGLFDTDTRFFYNNAKSEERPWEINIGVGNFAKLRLAKRDNGDYEEYFALKKILSEKELERKTIFGNYTREQIIEATKRELDFQSSLSAALKNTRYLSCFMINIDSECRNNKKDEKQVYQVMPFADIGNGHDFLKLKEQTHLTTNEQLDLFADIALTLTQSLVAIHEKLFFLRDIKPENILFSSKGNRWFSDFGAAASYDDKLDAICTVSNLHDLAYLSPYDLYFILSKAPKKLDDKPIHQSTLDDWHDTWALALTLLQLWCGDLTQWVKANLLDIAKQFHSEASQLSLKTVIQTYDAALKELKELQAFKTIPEPWQTIILTMLETNWQNRKPLSTILRDHIGEKSISVKDKLVADLVFAKLTAKHQIKHSPADQAAETSSYVEGAEKPFFLDAAENASYLGDWDDTNEEPTGSRLSWNT